MQNTPIPQPSPLTPPSPMGAAAPPPAQPDLRGFGDAAATRRLIFDNALRAAQAIEAVSNPRHTLSVANVRYEGPERYSLAQQKQALLSGGSLNRKLVGDWVLSDPTGQELGRKKATLARVPYFTDRGTFILNGSDWTAAHQLRLRPGIYARQKESGDYEAHVNVSKGFGHRLHLDPSKGVFKVDIGQAQIPLLPLLKAMGVPESTLRKKWGSELLAINQQNDDSQAIKKLFAKLHRDKDAPGDPVEMSQAVVQAFEAMELDPEVTERTLGKAHKNVTADALLDATSKLLKIAQGKADHDDRDAMEFQTLMGPEDYFAERIKKAKMVARQILWRASATGKLDKVPSNAYGDAVLSALVGSGLAQPLEEVNLAEVFDQQSRVTRMGQGGIESGDSVPDESRSVQPSQFGLIDFLRTPESGRVGIDLRLARSARKGPDGRIYTQVRDTQGQLVYKNAQQIAKSTLAFPGELKSGERFVAAMQQGRMRMVDRNKVDFELPEMEDAFSPLGNLVPFKSMLKGQRATMAGRFLTQALPIVKAEAPLVQSGMPGSNGRSFEQEYGKHLGAMFAEKPARVKSVGPEGILLQYQDGSTELKETYDNFPMNRKTSLHHTPMVQPGDVVQPGQLLARSNFTDDQGTAAIGLNARVAYIPWGGLNFEDAVVVSESFGQRATSEHMYQHEHERDENDKPGLKAFMSSFPAVYDRKTLANFDDDGVVKPGTLVKPDDPLILMTRQREPNRKSLLRGGSRSFQNATVTWDHHSPGVVTDVVKTDKGVSVAVKSTNPLQVGDKLSGRHGDKGIVAAVVPDDQMPSAADGKPFEVLLNPLGITSRTNPAQIVEAALGKLAAVRGEPFRVPDFQNEEDLIEFAMKELQKAGISDTETITDPRNGRKIPEIMAGNRWIMKLHHTAEGKAAGRGLGAYTADQTPAKGGDTGAKRVGMLELNSMLSHGATENVRGINLIRGQANPQYWTQVQSGFKPPTPGVPFAYRKFIAQLQASGANVVREGNRVHIMALTDDAIQQYAGDRELKNVETVDWKTMEPIKGGLFDPALTGGHMTADGGGNRWSFIKLHEPMPNPVMEEPIQHLLGLTKNKLRDVLSGKEALNGKKGPSAIVGALNAINIDNEIERARAEIASGKRMARDKAVRRLGLLKDAKRIGVHPRQWVLTKAPVLPPAFRPVSTMGKNKLPLVDDANYLYRELFDANSNLKDIVSRLGDDDATDERLAVYDAFKAVTGLGAPTHPKNQERRVQGILKHVFGSSPKLGTVQRRLLGSSVDLVGRSVIAPDPDLDMDQVGIPESKAWEIYRPLLVGRLVRGGMPRVAAARAVESRSPDARKALLQEVESGIVIINRAPTLHRYGMMAARPRLVRGDVLKISPLVVGGFGADFDGDAMNYHVPATEEERAEAAEKMLPSRNLFSAASFGVHYAPSQEYVGGLYEASARIDKEKPPMTFATKADAIRAYQQGRIGLGRRVEILDR